MDQCPHIEINFNGNVFKLFVNGKKYAVANTMEFLNECINEAIKDYFVECEERTRKFFDIETREIITEDVLRETLEELKECDPDTYGDITLGQYINNCLTINNGTLEEV